MKMPFVSRKKYEIEKHNLRMLNMSRQEYIEENIEFQRKIYALEADIENLKAENEELRKGQEMLNDQLKKAEETKKCTCKKVAEEKKVGRLRKSKKSEE